MTYLYKHQAKGEMVTGLLYLDKEMGELHGQIETTSTPLNQLTDAVIFPGKDVLASINSAHG